MSMCVFGSGRASQSALACLLLFLLFVPTTATGYEEEDGVSTVVERDLLRDLFDLSKPLTDRVEACNRLAKTADPEVLRFLIYILADQEMEVRAAAARGLSHFRQVEAVQALVILVDKSEESDEVKEAALKSLAVRRSRAARETLARKSQDSSESQELRRTARELLLKYFPEDTRVALDREGRNLALVSGGIYGSWSLMTLGWLRENPTSMYVGVFSGAPLGALVTHHMLRERAVTNGQASSLLSNQLWGAWSGVAFGVAADFHDSRAIMASGWTGQTLGLLWGLRLARGVPDIGDIMFGNLGGFMGTSIAGGALVASDNNDKQVVFGSLAAGGLLGKGLASILAPRLSFSTGDIHLTTLLMFESVWLGTFGPRALQENPSDRTIATSLLWGVPSAFWIGSALAQHTEPHPESVDVAATLGLYGKTLGAGIPMLGGNDDPRAVSASMLATSSLSLLSAVSIAPRMKLSDDDTILVMAGTAWGAWQGIGVSAAADVEDVRAQGAILTSTSMGGLIMMKAATELEIPKRDTLLASSLGFWGAWVPLWAGIAGDLPGRTITTFSLIGSDLGLLTSSLHIRSNPNATRNLVIVNMGGLAGAALGSTIAGIATARAKPVQTANAIGSAAGLLVGSVVARASTPAESDTDLVSSPSGAGWGDTRLIREVFMFPVHEPDWHGSGHPLSGVTLVARW